MTKGDANEPVTRGMLNEAVDAVLKGMDNLFERFKSEIAPIKKDVAQLKEDVGSIKSEIGFIQGDVKDINAELSDTPSRREFNNLKETVEEHILAS